MISHSRCWGLLRSLSIPLCFVLLALRSLTVSTIVNKAMMSQNQLHWWASLGLMGGRGMLWQPMWFKLNGCGSHSACARTLYGPETDSDCGSDRGSVGSGRTLMLPGGGPGDDPDRNEWWYHPLWEIPDEHYDYDEEIPDSPSSDSDEEPGPSLKRLKRD